MCNCFAFYSVIKANVGDSRAIASVKGTVHQLSFDHKPSNESETKRIIAAGGWVEFNRVNGKYFIFIFFIPVHALFGNVIPLYIY